MGHVRQKGLDYIEATIVLDVEYMYTMSSRDQ